MEIDMKQTHGTLARPEMSPAWLKRFGVGGFLFFLIKGLLWLMFPAVLAFVGME